MKWLRQLQCRLGAHGAGNYCPYCGVALRPARLVRFRVRSHPDDTLDTEVDAIDAQHAVGLAAPGWHRANIVAERIESPHVKGTHE